MIILGFETTDSLGSVAVFKQDGTVSELVLDSKRRHAESVLDSAEQLLNAQNLSLNDIDAFAVDVGPGSFTGVRIGVCIANALAYSHHKPVIGVNALETLAEPFSQSVFPVCAIIDARNGNGYAALYQKGLCLMEPAACVISQFLEVIPQNSLITGTAARDHAMPTASSVVRLASRLHGQGQVSPFYLKLSQAERLLND